MTDKEKYDFIDHVVHLTLSVEDGLLNEHGGDYSGLEEDGIDSNKYYRIITERVINILKKNNNYMQEEPASEELEEVANKYGKETFVNECMENGVCDKYDLADAFKAGAKWQEDKDKQTLNEEGVVVLPEEEFERMKRSLIKLAEREKQMFAKAIDADVKVDAGGYPYIPQIELYDYNKDVPLAKEGDKYKVILIKEG